MKKFILAASLFLMFNNALSAMEKKECNPGSCKMEPQQFIVTGYGKVPYTPDLMDIQFSVSVRDSDSESSKKKHDKIMVKVNKYLKEKEFPDGILALQSSILQRQNSSTGKKDDDFYLARSAYLLHTDRVQDMNALQIELVEIGIDEIQAVTLLSSKQRQLEDEARKLALKDAIEKADLTAKTMGLNLGKPVNLSYDVNFAKSGNFIEVMVRVVFSFQTETSAKEIVPANVGQQ